MPSHNALHRCKFTRVHFDGCMWLQGPHFEDVLDIVVPHQERPLSLSVSGRCWQEGLHIAGARYSRSRVAGCMLGSQPIASAAPPERHLEATFAQPVHLGSSGSLVLEVRHCNTSPSVVLSIGLICICRGKGCDFAL